MQRWRHYLGAGKKAQSEKAPTAKVEDLCSVPGTHILGENQLLQVVIWPSHVCYARTLHPQRRNCKKEKILHLRLEGVKTEAVFVVNNDKREEKATTNTKGMISTKRGFLLTKLFTPMLWFSSCKYTGAQFLQKKHRIREICRNKNQNHSEGLR